MRRDVGLILAALGVLLIVAAVSLPAYINARVVKFPLNQFETATLTATNVEYVSPATGTEETGVTVRASYTIKGAGSAGNSSTSVWDEVQYAYDVTNGQLQGYSTRRAAFDRKTAQLVNCCGANINGKTVAQSGIVGWVFPIGTKKQTYQVFDTTLNRPEPFVYSGTDTTGGIQTYKFVENVPPTQFASLTVPGSFVGSSASSVSAPEIYQTHVIYWVDPETGALLNVNNFEELTVQNPSTGATGAVLYKGDLTMTPASLQTIVNLDSNGRTDLFLLNTLMPLVFGIAGAAALIGGILLAGRRGPGGAEALPLSAMAAPAVADAVPAPAGTGGATSHLVPGLEGRATGPGASGYVTESPPADPAM